MRGVLAAPGPAARARGGPRPPVPTAGRQRERDSGGHALVSSSFLSFGPIRSGRPRGAAVLVPMRARPERGHGRMQRTRRRPVGPGKGTRPGWKLGGRSLPSAPATSRERSRMRRHLSDGNSHRGSLASPPDIQLAQPSRTYTSRPVARRRRPLVRARRWRRITVETTQQEPRNDEASLLEKRHLRISGCSRH